MLQHTSTTNHFFEAQTNILHKNYVQKRKLNPNYLLAPKYRNSTQSIKSHTTKSKIYSKTQRGHSDSAVVSEDNLRRLKNKLWNANSINR